MGGPTTSSETGVRTTTQAGVLASLLDERAEAGTPFKALSRSYVVLAATLVVLSFFTSTGDEAVLGDAEPPLLPAGQLTVAVSAVTVALGVIVAAFAWSPGRRR